MSEHTTPGPWMAQEPNGPGMGWRVGPAWLGEAPWSDETSANARLIAASPDMLAACEKMLALLIRYENKSIAPEVGTGAAIDAATAAIAKARGQ